MSLSSSSNRLLGPFCNHNFLHLPPPPPSPPPSAQLWEPKKRKTSLPLAILTGFCSRHILCEYFDSYVHLLSRKRRAEQAVEGRGAEHPELSLSFTLSLRPAADTRPRSPAARRPRSAPPRTVPYAVSRTLEARGPRSSWLSLCLLLPPPCGLQLSQLRGLWSLWSSVSGVGAEPGSWSWRDGESRSSVPLTTAAAAATIITL